jgi:hypothetical protein
MNRESVRKLSIVAFWGSYKSTPVKHTVNICYSPSLRLPIYNLRSDVQLARLVHENGQPLITHSLRYHSLSGTISFQVPHPSVLRPATSQARLHGVSGQKSMYETFLTETVGSGLCSFFLYTRKKDIGPKSNICL